MSSTKPVPEVGQIWHHKDIAKERYVKVISLLPLTYNDKPTLADALVRSCDPRGEFCPKTPQITLSINLLQSRYVLVGAQATIDSEHHNS